jgi:hypothetical protein
MNRQNAGDFYSHKSILYDIITEEKLCACIKTYQTVESKE